MPLPILYVISGQIKDPTLIPSQGHITLSERWKGALVQMEMWSFSLPSLSSSSGHKQKKKSQKGTFLKKHLVRITSLRSIVKNKLSTMVLEIFAEIPNAEIYMTVALAILQQLQRGFSILLSSNVDAVPIYENQFVRNKLSCSVC